MHSKIRYEFVAEVWQHAGPNGWYFVSLPVTMATEIREGLKWQEEGWGRLKATARVGNDQWETAIWFATRQNTYLLPIKAAIRKKSNIEAGKSITVTIWI